MSRSIRTLSAILAAVLAGQSLPARAEPQKLWELAGFATPESVLPDPARGIAYVSSMDGEPTAKDGNGFISKISLDGKMLDLRWATGFDAPKGMALIKDRLYVADIDKLTEIDIATGTTIAKHEAQGAKFLNDIAADSEGRVYVSDMGSNTIWRLADGRFELWVEDAALNAPNGLTVREGKLIVASFGNPGKDGETGVLGSLVEVSLADKFIRDLDGDPIGALDGLESLTDNAYLVSDWIKGALYRVDGSGKAGLLLDLNQGSADIGYVSSGKIVLIPMMLDNLVAAYKAE